VTDTKTLSRRADAACITAAIIAMLTWTWRTWPDPLVDYGRELYIAWQLSLGKVLFRDVAYYDGPLAPYSNALLIKIFGASLVPILIANFLIFVATLFLLYKLVERISGRFAATTGTVVVVAICGFGRMTVCGNYNWMAPYSHQLTYGFFLSLACLAILFLPRELTRMSALSTGVLLGLVLLTKVEVAAAALLSVAVGFALRVHDRSASRVPMIVLFAGGVMLPIVSAFGMLRLAMPTGEALRGTLGSSYWALTSNVSSLPYYKAGMGIDAISQNARAILAGALFLFIAAAIAWTVGRLTSKIYRRRQKLVTGTVFVLATLLLLPTLSSPHWLESIPKALPVLVAVVLLISAIEYFHSDPDESHDRALNVSFAVLALVLLGKMLLNTRLYHYGFVLAIPALVITVSFFIDWLPRLALKLGGAPAVVRAFGLSLILLMVVVHLGSMIPVIRDQRHVVARGGNSFIADDRGAAEQLMLNFIDRNVPADATIVVLPEGAMMNFLTARQNPTPYSTFMPAEMLVFGEDQMLNSLQTRPPDFIVLAHKDTSEYGVPLFGRDYGKRVGSWVRENYSPVVKVGEIPLQDPESFGIMLMRRKGVSLASR
jgi:hypothetical protein